MGLPEKLSFEVRFLTPAFLGDAFQNGRWRTPPFKALLREWWRVAYAEAHGFNVDVSQMRKEEGLLFGNAWLKGSNGKGMYCKSAVRLTLSEWKIGKLININDQYRVYHPDVGFKVGSMLYLGYGPLDYDKKTKRTVLKENNKDKAKKKFAIDFNDSAVLTVSINSSSTERKEEIKRALALINLYGAIGGRSRNGWGSVELRGTDDKAKESLEISSPPFHHWKKAMDIDWPHAIGKDDNGKPLIWQTTPRPGWEDIIKVLAEIKIGLRTQFSFPKKVKLPHINPLERHWLSYPVTNHPVKAWEKATNKNLKNSLRLPNTLRFKIRKTPEGLAGVIFHVPHLPPEKFSPNKNTIFAVWQKVYGYLDGHNQLKRIGA